MKVFAYIRVSTEEQADKGNSLFEQQERLQAYCRAMGWSEPLLFIDDGVSAKDINRRQLTRMLEQIKQHDEGVIITTKLDRLSRKLFDILSLVEYFNKHNFKYVSQSEGFDTATPAGRLVMQMLGMVAEFERERIRERVQDNMRSIARNTLKVISRPCFGYTVKEGVMQPDIDESLIVKQMYMWALAGDGSRAIAGRLNALGLKTKEGNVWHDKVVRELLQRDTMIGQFTYNKTYKKAGKTITRPESEWIVIPDHHAPIIDLETYDKVCEMFEARKTVGRHVKDDTFLLSGLVYCSHCGEKMNGKTNRSFSKRLNQENVRYQYLCNGYLKKKICYHHWVERDAIEKLIIDRIREMVHAQPGSLELVISAPKKEDIDSSLIQASLDKLDARMQKQIDAYTEDLITAADLKRATESVNAKRQELERMLAAATANSSEQVQQQLAERAGQQIKSILSEDRVQAKSAIRQLVDRIEVLNGSDIRIIWRGF